MTQTPTASSNGKPISTIISSHDTTAPARPYQKVLICHSKWLATQVPATSSRLR